MLLKLRIEFQPHDVYVKYCAALLKSTHVFWSVERPHWVWLGGPNALLIECPCSSVRDSGTEARRSVHELYLKVARLARSQLPEPFCLCRTPPNRREMKSSGKSSKGSHLQYLKSHKSNIQKGREKSYIRLIIVFSTTRGKGFGILGTDHHNCYDYYRLLLPLLSRIM